MKSMLKLYGHYVSIHIKSIMQYKMSFLLTAIGQFLVSFYAFLGIFFLFQRFSNIEGFTYSEVLLCFSIILMEFSIAECFARGFDQFSSMVKDGTFDRVLVRPRGTILQVLGSKFELTRFARMFQAVIIFFYAISKINLNWNIQKILTVLFMLLGGTAIFTGLFLVYAALCFFTLEGLEFMNIFTDGAREFAKYPLGIYGKRILQFCTCIIPYALVQHYPLLYILERKQDIVWIFVPLLAFLFLIPCYLLWRLGVRKYQSSGS